jgi:hypothetical protein
MRIFISWSGEVSKKVAELLHEWIPSVIQAARPWVSSHDIDGGANWINAINAQLADTSIGLICLTKENLTKPWILFEAGALSKGLDSARVCPLLIDLNPADLAPPLSQFNNIRIAKEPVFKLIKTINELLAETKLTDAMVAKAFETYWPQFEDQFKKIKKASPENEEAVRSDREILLEMLNAVRAIDRRMVDSSVSQTSYTVFDSDEYIAPTFKSFSQIKAPKGRLEILRLHLRKQGELGIPIADTISDLQKYTDYTTNEINFALPTAEKNPYRPE